MLKNVNCIINLAAIHRDDIRLLSLYDDLNVQGSVNVCEVARKHGIKKLELVLGLIRTSFGIDASDCMLGGQSSIAEIKTESHYE